MKARAAVLWGVGEPMTIEDVELDDPGPGEVLVDLRATGLCHSDEHVATGDMLVPHFPFIIGHEGAGEVAEVGPGVTSVAVGDHVAFSFIPSCGRCRWCAAGMSFICDEGAKLFNTGMMTDDRVAHRIAGEPAARFAQLGAFSEQQLVAESSVVKVDPSLPWHAVALVSCGVATGYGSAVRRADVRPGDTVAVIGTGGVGMNAVQGARIAGARRIIAIDPRQNKRDWAKDFGATHTFASAAEAAGPVFELTEGLMCDAVICVPSVMTGELVEPALTLTAKGGSCVVTGVAAMATTEVSMNLFMFAMMNKEIKGCIFGSGNPRADIPALLALYRDGVLKLDELVTATYSLDQVNEGYRDLRESRILRGVVTF
jgi:S-(hydroxymethyl)glutathione dehydrogenase/alcohol dehydrogenase